MKKNSLDYVWSATFFILFFSAPTGQMDVWQDCGMPATNIDCAMIWKVVNTQFLILKW